MRMVAMLVLGLAIGVFAAVTVISGMRQETPYSKAVMAVTKRNYDDLRALAESGRCDARVAGAHLRTLAALANDIGPAFLPTGMDDALFERHLQAYRSRVDAAFAAAPADCAALKPLVVDVGAGCKECHADFKP
jgi:cytochrome c556